MQIITEFNSANIYHNIQTKLSAELFTSLLENKKVRIERIVSEGHFTPINEWYDQLQDEWVIVLQGQADLDFENSTTHSLTVGDYLFIPAHTRHRVSKTTLNEQTIWLVVHWY